MILVNENTEELLQSLKKIYPDIIKIVDNWALFSSIHGNELVDSDKATLADFAILMKKVGIAD